MKNFKRAAVPIFALLALAFFVFAIASCELLVNLDLTLVDAGPDGGCAICVDGMVVTDEAGDPIAIVPLDAGAHDAASDATSE
jgi:hypothetical protein